jgi:DNA-directed RNA polymerase subunit RPC12/RpoP
MKYREVRRCAICGRVAAANKFGDGITCPKTTCLNCKKKVIEFVEPKTPMDVKRIIRGVK